HIAIIMDGNGRWASQKGLPRSIGHKAGVQVLRDTVAHCAARGVQSLTAYAFSSENWQRPAKEVNFLLQLFVTALEEQLDSLNKNNVRLGFIGNLQAFPEQLQASIAAAEDKTRHNTGLRLVVAANYGGRWEISRICQDIARQVQGGELQPEAVTEELISSRTGNIVKDDPDLFIRTGGERRISNYLLWQLAYSELYFTDVFWPDFNEQELERALQWYVGRERRFGRVQEQEPEAAP
ncbi:MAG: polyprenyl diphosphate synthase, partial [Gammaproteobacteria bacterium]